jgi:AraC-like DNA-binding protein
MLMEVDGGASVAAMAGESSQRVIVRSLSDPLFSSAMASAHLNDLCRHTSCIVLARGRALETAMAPRPLTIATVRGGVETYSSGRRKMAVNDDTFLILNEGKPHSSVLRAEADVETFRILFRADLVDDVLGALVQPTDRLLERESPQAGFSFEFSEGLQPHDRLVSPVLKYIRQHALTGSDDSLWFDEQIGYLLERMLMTHRAVVRKVQALPCARMETRRELHRRVSLAVDHIEACFDQPLSLDSLAKVACLSKFHFQRAFCALLGLTPRDYLQRKRALAAKRLLATTELSASEIALRVGYASRTSLTKQVRRWTGAAPGQLRHRMSLGTESTEDFWVATWGGHHNAS